MSAIVRLCGLARGLLLATALHAATGLAAPAPDLLLEARIEPASVLVQEQALYRLRFLQAIDIGSFRLLGPSARLAELRPLGADRVFETRRDGRRYRVTERRYAVFPFASGTLELAGARVVSDKRPATPARRVEAAPTRLEVRPVPREWPNAPWLPAASMQLSEEWTAAADGAPRYRRIRIEAAGVLAEQLPEAVFGSDALLVRAETPHLSERIDGNLIVGTRQQTFELLPLKPGEPVLPELRIAWWDLRSGRPQTAVLPSRRLHFATHLAGIGEEKTAAALPSTTDSPIDSLAQVTLAALLAALLVALFSIGRRRRSHARRRLRAAIAKGNDRELRDALLSWARHRWPESPPRSLPELGERLDDGVARDALNEFDRHLHGPADDGFDRQKLVQALGRGSPAARLAAGESAMLRPLYPERQA